jgi:hypothetical protein
MRRTRNEWHGMDGEDCVTLKISLHHFTERGNQNGRNYVVTTHRVFSTRSSRRHQILSPSVSLEAAASFYNSQELGANEKGD